MVDLMSEVRKRLQRRSPGGDDVGEEEPQEAVPTDKLIDEVANRKVEREWARMANQVKISLTKVGAAMKQCLSDFQASPTRAFMFTDGLQVGQRRFHSSDLVALARVGPCEGFAKFVDL